MFKCTDEMCTGKLLIKYFFSVRCLLLLSLWQITSIQDSTSIQIIIINMSIKRHILYEDRGKEKRTIIDMNQQQDIRMEAKTFKHI